jgi:type IV secretory pathway VirB10-like protein
MVIARGSDEDECCWIRESQEASATLYSSIDSTVPNGTIRAYLDLSLEDWTHSIVVAPYGAVFAGRYLGTSTTVTGGQVRIPAEFNEIIAGNRKIKLDDEPGGDPTGTNGLGAATNRHIGAAIGSFVIQVATAALLDRGANGSQYCVGSGCSQSSSGTNSNGIGGAMQAGRQLFQGNAPPSQSLQVRSGSKITIIFQHDYRVKEWKP